MKRFVMMLEDDPDDRFLTKDVMDALNISVPIQFYSDSNTLLSSVDSANLPLLFLIDYNSTPENGVTVCRKLKEDHRTKEIPVIILSETGITEYRNAAYEAGANSFITKPPSMEETKKKIASFFHYWLEVATV
jgi:CheY-like chemotaxis protein